ncbi:hypothetical protein [Methylobacterium marchantiae]|uniref:Uncharacterized protein n=1 Tax=Methylobacterium marchantiae TaxID=600331 RepID=A0ABW3X0V0_9HYPH|nr:hypothetical protein AIGOOFII_3955 [Methylobacterium marchantiae]
MTGRSRRDFDRLSEAQIAAGLISKKRIDPAVLVAKDIGELLNTIDAVAEVATGDRSFLHFRPTAPHPDEGRRQDMPPPILRLV